MLDNTLRLKFWHLKIIRIRIQVSQYDDAYIYEVTLKQQLNLNS